jgi:hypothetical protein
LDTLEKQTKNTRLVFKCGAGEGLEITWTESEKTEEVLHEDKEERNIYIQRTIKKD